MAVVWTYLLCILWIDQVYLLPAGRNISLTQLFSTELAELPEMERSVKRVYNGKGVHAQENTVFLGPDATMFRLHRPGFQHVAKSVSLESNVQPGLYLRYKNYKFRLEQAKPTGLFEKDSTFIERHPFGPDSMALELFSHPGWFICHDVVQPFTLRAASKVIRSKEFDQKCVFRQVIHKAFMSPNSRPSSAPRDTDKMENEEKKAAELLDSLVSQESVGDILVKSGQKKSEQVPVPIVGIPESVGPSPTHDIVPKKEAPLKLIPKMAPKASRLFNIVPNAPQRAFKSNLLNMVPKNVRPQSTSLIKTFPQSNPALMNMGRPKKMNALVPSRLANMMPKAMRGTQFMGAGIKNQGSFRPHSNLAKMFPKPLKPFNNALARMSFQRNQQLNRIKLAKLRYINALRRKAFAMKTLPRMQYAGYLSGIKKQNAGYNKNFNTRPMIQQYANKMNWPGLMGGVRRPLAPGAIRPGKILPMTRVTALKTSPAMQKPKPTPFKFVAVGNVQDVGDQASSSKKASNALHLPEKPMKEPKVIDPKTAVYNLGDKCISIRFYNKIRKPVRIVSSMKRAGYLVTAETFKLKTIFKHARKDRKVHFYAQDLDDKDDILLNNNNVITVIPGPCDLPYRSIYLSKNGQFSNDEIEKFLKIEEEKLSSELIKKSVSANTNSADGFSQWSTFSPCSASCGNGVQTRSRTCLPKRACLGATKESRACILTPCAEPVKCTKTSGGNSGGKCCAMPFIYQDTVYDKCITHAQTGGLWCATTPNFDSDKSWGFCKTAERRSEFYRPEKPASTPVSPLTYRALVPNTCDKSCYNMCVPGCHATCCSAHALAFPSI